jgi:hypothetical protein
VLLGGLERRDAVLGLGHHLHVGLALDQHAEPRAHDAVVVRDQDADHVAAFTSSAMRSVTVVPPPGAERTSSSPPARRARSAIPLSPEPRARAVTVRAARERRGVEARPVVADAQLEALPVRLELDGHGGGAGVAADVRERLLEDPVDGRLHVLGESVRVALELRLTWTPVRAEKRLSCVSTAGTRPWSSSAVGRSWRAS